MTPGQSRVVRQTPPVGYLAVAKQISKPDKTSLVIDRKKLSDAKKILGTRTIAETVDGALDEVIRLAARRRLLAPDREEQDRRNRADAGRTQAASRAVGASLPRGHERVESQHRGTRDRSGPSSSEPTGSRSAHRSGSSFSTPPVAARSTQAFEATWPRCRSFRWTSYAIALAERTQVSLAASVAASRAEGDRPARRRSRGGFRSDLLHYDRHFDAIARVTGQPTEWLARRGSLD